MTNAAYCVRAERGIYAQAFQAGGYAAVGWLPGKDLSNIPEGDINSLGTIYDSDYPADGNLRRGQNLGQT